nr:DNA methyltransferase [Rickettsia endosymbiont of Ceutorhynchus assimilis]
MISNSDTGFIRNLYKNYNINTVEIKYLISGQTKTSTEVVVTNY